MHRWLREDPVFIAAWNAWRREQAQMARAQLIGMAAEAVEAVREAVRNGDGRLALSLLKGVGILEPEKAGSEDPGRVAWEVEEKEEVLKLINRELGMGN